MIPYIAVLVQVYVCLCTQFVPLFKVTNVLMVTIIILSFGTDRPWQTVQSDQGPHCLSFCLHLSDSLLFCLDFRIITAVFQVSEYLGVSGIAYVIPWPHYVNQDCYIPKCLSSCVGFKNGSCEFFYQLSRSRSKVSTLEYNGQMIMS